MASQGRREFTLSGREAGKNWEENEMIVAEDIKAADTQVEE